MRRIVFLAFSTALLLVGCSDATSLFPSALVCRSNGDCPQGSSCSEGVCVGTDGTPVRGEPNDDGTGGRGTLDAGTTPTEDAGGNPQLDVSVQDSGGGACVPDCTGRECGDDGCGGACGICSGGETCVAGVCSGGGGGETGTSCAEIVTCVNACADEACFQRCIEAGTPTAQGQINAIINCLQTNCSGVDPNDAEAFAQCQQNFCSAELNACSGGGGGGGGGTGDASCNEIVDCVLTCTSQECAQACVGDGTPAAQNAAVAYVNCAAEACAEATSVDDFISCARSSCPSEASACDAN